MSEALTSWRPRRSRQRLLPLSGQGGATPPGPNTWHSNTDNRFVHRADIGATTMCRGIAMYADAAVVRPCLADAMARELRHARIIFTRHQTKIESAMFWRQLRIPASVATALLLAGLAACSSSFGGGSSPPAPDTVVLPPGSRVVCSDGLPPPCR